MTAGSSISIRREIIDAGVKAHREQIRVEEAGGRKMFRTREFDRDERQKKKNKRSNWWRKPNRSGSIPITYMKIPFTHNSALKKEMEKISRESGLLVKFVET